MDATPLEITVRPHHDAYGDDHPAFRAQVSRLSGDLTGQVEGARRDRHPVPGSKGAVEDLVIALGQAGVLTVALDMLRTWLRRDRARSIEIVWTDGGEEHRVTMRGDAVDLAMLQPVADAAAARIGEGAWTASDTAPS